MREAIKVFAVGVLTFFMATTCQPQSAESPASSARPRQPIVYTNKQYGFKFYLPKSWKGYSIVVTNWEGGIFEPPPDGTGIDNIQQFESGPKIVIRHPRWTEEHRYQDIPIMVFTPSQWELVGKGNLIVSAAPVGPGELGRNCRYVFALPARYNYVDAAGVEEVNQIMSGKPLRAF
jgi:hypothetical protein